MADIIKIKKGLDIPLAGNADLNHREKVKPDRVGILPDDYPGYTWKLAVKQGDKVGCGSVLMRAKENHELCLTSPSQGVLEEIRRGERRHITALVIDCKQEGKESETIEILDDDEASITSTICRSGLWAHMRQRPYDIIPSPEVKPRDIFITAFDTAPLAISNLVDDQTEALRKGIQILKRLTDGKVYLGVKFGSGLNVPEAEVTEYDGPHPAGNVGTQIAAISPVNKGEVVWTLDTITVIRIGKLFTDGKVDVSARVAVVGPQIKNPGIAETICGCDMKSLLRPFEILTPDDDRYISGNVLTGIPVDSADGFLHYPWRQATVIEEGKKVEEFMGWASISPKKYSVKRSFPAFLFGKKNRFNFDARLKGGRRAPILSGEYDNVFPMDIYPEFLLKAISANDIDKMERLGIYEVAPEDFALAEFVDTSKNPLQLMVRDGLERMRKEMD